MIEETIKFKQKNWTGMFAEVTFRENGDRTEFEMLGYDFVAIKDGKVVRIFESGNLCNIPVFTLHLVDNIWACNDCGIYRENEDFRILAGQMISNLY
jgi:hypothetical protein